MAERRAKRFQPKEPVAVTVTAGGHNFVAAMADISATGLRVRCSQQLHAGTIVRLVIGSLHHGVHTMAVVSRTDEWGAAFEFRHMTMTDREALRKLLQKLSNAAIET